MRREATKLLGRAAPEDDFADELDDEGEPDTPGYHIDVTR